MLAGLLFWALCGAKLDVGVGACEGVVWAEEGAGESCVGC
jgi:hypothetical protein